MFRSLLLSFSLLVSLLATPTAFAQIYRWVDEDGKVQFSDRPVRGKTTKEVEVNTSKNSYGGGKVVERQRDLLDRYEKQDQQAKERKILAQKKKAEQKKLNAACHEAKDRLATYERGSLYTLDDKGERVYFSEEKRAQAIAEFREQIRKNCK